MTQNMQQLSEAAAKREQERVASEIADAQIRVVTAAYSQGAAYTNPPSSRATLAGLHLRLERKEDSVHHERAGDRGSAIQDRGRTRTPARAQAHDRGHCAGLQDRQRRAAHAAQSHQRRRARPPLRERRISACGSGRIDGAVGRPAGDNRRERKRRPVPCTQNWLNITARVFAGRITLLLRYFSLTPLTESSPFPKGHSRSFPRLRA